MLKREIASTVYKPSKAAKWATRLNFHSIWTGLIAKEQIIINLIAFLLGRAVMFSQLSPFALAYFIALRKFKPQMALYSLLGISIGYYSALGIIPLTMLLISIAVFLGFERIFLSHTLRTRWQWSILAFSANFFVKIPWLLSRSLLRSEIITLLIESSLVAVLLLIFQDGIGVLLGRANDKIVSSEELICLSVLLAGCLAGLHALSIANIKIENIFIHFAIMYIAVCGGSHLATVAGLVLSFIANIAEGIMLSRLGLYSFVGLVAGLCRDYKRLGVIASYIGTYALLNYYSVGNLIWLELMPEVCIAGLGLMLLPKAWLEQSSNILGRFRIDKKYINEDTTHYREAMLQKIEEFSNIFTSLADVFKLNPTLAADNTNQYEPVLDRLCQAVCQNCALQRRCWSDDYAVTKQAFLTAITLAEQKGYVDKEDIGKPVGKRCLYLDRIEEQLSQILEIYRLNMYWQKRIADNNQLVGIQLHGIAEIVKDLTRQFEPVGNQEQHIAQQLRKALTENQIAVNDIRVEQSAGDKVRIVIHKPSCQGKTHCNTVIIPTVSKVLGQKVTRQHARCATLSGDKECVISLTSEPAYEAICGIAQLTASGNKISGDSYALVELPGGKFAVLLSDGMGSGPRAHEESDITIRVLQKVLETGFSKDTAIKTINTVLALHSIEETFATVDLVLIDLYSAKAEFVKIGASMTLCKRGSNVQTIQSSSLPAGVFCDIIPDEYEILMASEDLLIMISDGVLESQRDIIDKEGWIKRIVSQAVGNHPQEIADYLIQQARQSCNNSIVDDMTVIVLLLRKSNAGALLRSA